MSRPPSAITTGSWSLWAPTGEVFVLGWGPASCVQSSTCLQWQTCLSSLILVLVIHRACVAGFTNITFNLQNEGLINGAGAESYVTFSHYSEAVFLPQDPGRGKTVVLSPVQGSTETHYLCASFGPGEGGVGVSASPLSEVEMSLGHWAQFSFPL